MRFSRSASDRSRSPASHTPRPGTLRAAARRARSRYARPCQPPGDPPGPRWRRIATRAVIPIGLVVLMVLTYSIALLDRAVIDTWIQEDGVFESFGAAALLAAAVFSFVGFLRTRRGINEGAGRRLTPAAFVMLALLFLVGAGEQVSWGQRTFGW